MPIWQALQELREWLLGCEALLLLLTYPLYNDRRQGMLYFVIIIIITLHFFFG
jgi:hypothetical protein